MRVLISGYYGFGNVGDEAVLQAIIQGLEKGDPSLEITVLSFFPGLTKETYQVDSVFCYDWYRIFLKMSKTDVFISGGGTLFQNVTSNRSFFYYLGLVFLAKLLRKKTVIFAQGFGPLQGTFYRALARFFLNRADLITLRDKDSYEEVKKLEVKNTALHLTADISAVLALPPAEEGKKILDLEGVKQTGRPLLGVSVRSLPRGNNKKFYKSMAGVIDWLSQTHHYSPLFMLFHLPSDMHTTAKVTALMKEKADLIFRSCRPDEMLGLISQLDLMIGMRLHSLIFAAMNSVPMLGLSYDPKVEAFMKSIDQPFLKTGEDMDPENIKKSLENILANKEKIKANLRGKRKELCSQAALNFEILFNSHPFNSRLIGEEDIIDFAGVKVDSLTLEEAAFKVEQLALSGPHLVVTPNPEIIVACQEDQALKEIINHASLRVPDGISMVVVSRIIGKPLKERVTGIDLMLKLIELSAEKNHKVFLLGSTPGVAEKAAKELQTKYPQLKIVGTHHGYFGDDSEVIDKIKNACPDILFVGLGAGRQEKWLNRHLKDLKIPVSMAIGGSLDVISGHKKRAPKWIQSLYVEWLYRLLTEPSRWKRQLALPKFLWLIFAAAR